MAGIVLGDVIHWLIGVLWLKRQAGCEGCAGFILPPNRKDRSAGRRDTCSAQFVLNRSNCFCATK